MRVPSKSLAQILAASHISAVAIAVLLIWSFDWGFRALLSLVIPAADFLVTAVAIRGIPFVSSTSVGGITWTLTVLYFLNAFMDFLAASFLSRWVYGVGLLRCLSRYGLILASRRHV